MAKVRDEAEVLALGLELGVVRPAEVVSWADGVIAKNDRVHWSIGELATMGTAYEQDLVAALRRIPGSPTAVGPCSRSFARCPSGFAIAASTTSRSPGPSFSLATCKAKASSYCGSEIRSAFGHRLCGEREGGEAPSHSAKRPSPGTALGKTERTSEQQSWSIRRLPTPRGSRVGFDLLGQPWMDKTRDRLIDELLIALDAAVASLP